MKKSDFDENLFAIGPQFSFLIASLFGDGEYLFSLEYMSKKDVKKYFKKILRSIEKSFLDTCINTDKYHHQSLTKLVSKGINEIESKSDISSIHMALTITLVRINFLLLGEMPNNFSRTKEKDNRAKWELNKFRQITYSQDNEQRLNQLLILIKNDGIEGLGPYSEVYKKYQEEGHGTVNMLDWFKRTYPQKYFEIFDAIK